MDARSLQLGIQAGSGIFNTDFPRVSPSYGVDAAYLFTESLSVGVYYQRTEGLSSDGNPWISDPNFRGAQSLFGAEVGWRSFLLKDLTLAFRAGAGTYEYPGRVLAFSSDSYGIFGMSAADHPHWGLKAAWEKETARGLWIGAQAAVFCVDFRETPTSYSLMASARIEPTAWISAASQVDLPRSPFKPRYSLEFETGTTFLARAGKTLNPALGISLVTEFAPRMLATAYFLRAFTRRDAQGDYQEQYGLRATYSPGQALWLELGGALARMTSPRYGQDRLSVAAGPFVGFEFLAFNRSILLLQADVLLSMGGYESDAATITLAYRLWSRSASRQEIKTTSVPVP